MLHHCDCYCKLFILHQTSTCKFYRNIKQSLTLINPATFKKFMPGMTRFDVQDSLRVFEKNYHFFIFSKRNTNFSMSFFGHFEKSFCLKIHGGGVWSHLLDEKSWNLIEKIEEKILSLKIYSTRIIPKIFPKICSTRKRKKYQNFNSFSIKKLQKRKNLNE